jgi:tryptophan synthase alpha chain
MSRITDKFTQLNAAGKRVLIPFVSAGDPDLATTRELVLEMERRGADIVELGVPFSDPIADGPTIQRASQRALQAGVTLKKVLDLVKQIRWQSQLPLVLMTYYNPIFKYGEERFVQDAIQAGVDGLIIPDLPPEEAGSLLQAAEDTPLDIIFLLAPTSTPERISLVSKCSRGFIYYVSLTGITGAKGAVVEQITNKLSQIKQVSDKPVAVGFGISTPEQAAQVAAQASGVIVGSAIIRVMEKHLSQPALMVPEVGEFVHQLKQAISV